MSKIRFLYITLLVLIAVPTLAQAPQNWVHPKTPWGDPDLQGIWPGNVGVPMQRPQNMGERTTLTDEEFGQRLAQAKRQAEADSQSIATSDMRVGIGPPSYWTERGRPTRQTSLIIDPPNGRLPPLTPEAEKYRKEARGGKGLPGEWRGEADSYDDLNIYYRCITRGLLGSVTLFMGDSRGHWEGNTLVVETTNFTDKDAIGSNGAGYPGDPGYHSDQLKIIERFTRVSDDRLEYRATVIDDKTWTRPWTILIELERNNNYQLLEYACHEGNYAMEDILSGARATDKK